MNSLSIVFQFAVQIIFIIIDIGFNISTLECRGLMICTNTSFRDILASR